MTEKKFSSADFKGLIKSGNLIIGSERTLKSLKLGKLKNVLVALNCDANVEKSLKYYSGLCNTEFIKLDYRNDELGVLCKKPFSISVIGILKV